MAKFMEKLKKKKTKKGKRFLAILGPFCPFLNKNDFSPTIGLCQFLDFAIIYHYAKNQKKTNECLRRKLLIDRRKADRQRSFCKTLRLRGSNTSKKSPYNIEF